MIEPEYYKNQDGIDLLTAFQKGILTKEEYIGFLKGNIMKYTQRCNKKHTTKKEQIQDINKAKTYLHHLEQIL